MPRILLLMAICLMAAAPSVTAQLFDAVSIRTTRQSMFGVGFVTIQPGRIVANETTLRELVSVAYGMPLERVVGGASWIDSARYAITGTTAGIAGREPAQRMLQAMLADRFALKVHQEKRDLPSYALTFSRRDGSFGPKLRRAGAECAPMTPQGLDGAPPPPPPPPPPPSGGAPMQPLMARESKLRCPTMFFPGGLSARAITFDEFVYRMTRFVSRPIVDRTGLTGEFDIDLVYQAELAATGPGAAATGPSVFSAVQDQLGLKLDPVRAPAEVIVIDSAAPPTEN